MGTCTLLGCDDLLAAFTCGSAFAWDGFYNTQTQEAVFSSVLDSLFNVGAFVYVGAWMPFGSLQSGDTSLTVWRLVIIALLILLLKRLPAVVALYAWIPDMRTYREAVFCGHFGPIGIGAIFISTLATGYLQQHQKDQGGAVNPQTELLIETMEPIVAFMVLCSVFVHGLSIPSFSLGKRVHSVSRTWSWRQRQGAQEEWVGQTRLVRSGEEIVVNRDPEVDLEKGKGKKKEKEGEKEGEVVWREGEVDVVERGGCGEEVSTFPSFFFESLLTFCF